MATTIESCDAALEIWLKAQYL